MVDCDAQPFAWLRGSAGYGTGHHSGVQSPCMAPPMVDLIWETLPSSFLDYAAIHAVLAPVSGRSNQYHWWSSLAISVDFADCKFGCSDTPFSQTSSILSLI